MVKLLEEGPAGCARKVGEEGVEAALVASIVHERPERLLELKAELKEAGWPIRT